MSLSGDHSGGCPTGWNIPELQRGSEHPHQPVMRRVIRGKATGKNKLRGARETLP